MYISVIQRCEHGISDTLILADVLLDQFCEDFPLVHEVCIKSHNTGSYHRNYCLEVLYNICKNTNITLLRYDYNKPYCGKDQCNRESAAALSLLGSFVNAGNHMTPANDIYKNYTMDLALKMPQLV